MRRSLVLAAALLPVAPLVAATLPVANAFNARVLALRPADRDGALRRAVTNENERCGRLSGAVYRGPHGNLGLWQAHCDPGGDYAIFVGGDGTTQVRECADVKSLKLPACLPPPPPARPRRR